MNIINKDEHNELLGILLELIKVIEKMRVNNDDGILRQNETEAKEWLLYLKGHVDKEELKSLEDEISDRLFYVFDVEIEKGELDCKRVELIKKYINISNGILK